MLHPFSVRSYDPRNVWFTIFGYVTATLATFFVGRDAENTEAELAGAKEVAVLREELRSFPGRGKTVVRCQCSSPDRVRMDKIQFGKYGIVFFCSFGVPRKHSGIAYGPIVFILPEYINDRGLLEHELVHTRQFWNPLKWFKGKLWWEVEAFKEQAKWYSDDRSHAYARLIATNYGLDIAVGNAEELLKS